MLDGLRELPGGPAGGDAAASGPAWCPSCPGEVHPHDVGTILDRHGVAVRAGHHCAQPVLHRLGVNATVRASFAAYSSPADVEALLRGLHEVRRMFA